MSQRRRGSPGLRRLLRTTKRRRFIWFVALVLVVLLWWASDSLRQLLSPWEWSWPQNAYRTRLPVPRRVPEQYHIPRDTHDQVNSTRRANAALVMLARNYELAAVLAAMKQVEDRFNKRHHYPWVLLNEVPFSKSFIQATKAITDAEVVHGKIENEEWFQPDWIDEDKAEAGRLRMDKDRILFAKSVAYRNMCRFNSGFFFSNKFLRPYRWYWRIEPGIEYFCDVNDDPFLYLEDNGKSYGFVMSMYENPATMPSLWNLAKDFAKANPGLIATDNAMKFISRDGGETYNQCQFYSNFEIADMDFWRGEAYQKFFKFIDDSGGFYYERWSDAPVHTIALALLANRSALHFFDDIGYRHPPYQHCPQGDARLKNRCSCLPGETFDDNRFSCLKHFRTTMEAS
ncbi:glycosyltransferase family 15 protein [Auriculariales sp. MPI-PUGE-AT-0066]|nr:glycosyltransferase family 15 protein [Auriculariales sp. MPI-PUGE-AT-0066]